MILLTLSILCNAALYLIFKWFERTGIQTLPAIVVNYFIACTLALFFVDDLGSAVESASRFPLWATGGLSLGIVFIAIFYLAAITAQKVGVSVTTIASKMSLVLVVVIFAFINPGDRISLQKGVAIAIALLGVVFASLRNGPGTFKIRDLAWPLLILAGSTFIDFGIAYFSSLALNDNERALYISLSFATAGLCGFLILLFNYFSKKRTIKRKDIIGGVVLGSFNYGSLFFLIECFEKSGLSRSTVVCLNNVGVVVVAAVAAVILFREKLTVLNLAGIALSLLAMLIFML